jgi:peptidoglycan/xylan/chitin deacetylase (PgdA/CDA1 family)
MNILDSARAWKVRLLLVLRACGFFALAQRLTRKQARILCFHGGSVIDEHIYSPGLFTSPATFARRMQILARSGLPVVPLDEAVGLLETGSVDAGQTVITFDDGWKTTFDQLIPIARRHGFPVTVYVTTAAAEERREVFPVALGYLVWSSDVTRVTITGWPDLDGVFDLGSSLPAEYDVPSWRREFLATVIAYADGAALDGEARGRLLLDIAAALQVDRRLVIDGYRFCIASPEELDRAFRAGVDLQLHTHSHRTAACAEEFRQEVLENRERLQRWTGGTPRHFCYPSGVVAAEQPQWLQELGMRSSTTTVHDFNSPATPRQLLNRYLDLELSDDIEFEAEITGVLEIFRRLRRFAKSLVNLRPSGPTRAAADGASS